MEKLSETDSSYRSAFTTSVPWADDLERTYHELRAKGVEFTAPPKVQEWGTSVILKDPDGNTFVLSSK